MFAAVDTDEQQLNKMESWLSGRRRTIGNRVGVMSVSRVQIPNSPPEVSCNRKIAALFACGDKNRKTARKGGKLTRKVGKVIPSSKGVTRMTTMEVLTLLMLLATVIFGILNYTKK